MKLLVCLIASVVVGLLVGLGATRAQAGDSPQPVIRISVANLDSGESIRDHSTVMAGTDFQVTVATNEVDCAGQFVVTARGAPGAPPSMLVQFAPFIVGPSSSANAVTTAPLDAGVLPSGVNDFKISATCNAAEAAHFASATFEFFAAAN